MRRYHPDNEVIKRDYFAFLRNAKGRDEATLDSVAAAIHDFEAATRYASFKTFGRAKAISYKARLGDQRHAKTGKPLSLATLHSRLGALKAFFEWLSQQHGYKRTVLFTDAAYFGLTTNEARAATARREPRTPSLDQIIQVLQSMPADTVIARRDRALIAFTILTGARDSAIASMRLKHVDSAKGHVTQDAREVRTKGAKTFTSAFFPIGDLPPQIVLSWLDELRDELRFGPDDPIFPATCSTCGSDGLFTAIGLSRAHWAGAAPIRAIFRTAFEAAGIEYFTPHSFRRTLMAVARARNLKHRELKAWSQNLGHNGVLTSLISYGQMSFDDQAEALAGLSAADDQADPELEAMVAEVLRLAKRSAV